MCFFSRKKNGARDQEKKINWQISDMLCYPPNFLEMLLEASNFLEGAAANEAITKEELCKSMEMRLSLLIGKAIASPTGGSFRVFNRDTTKTSAPAPPGT